MLFGLEKHLNVTYKQFEKLLWMFFKNKMKTQLNIWHYQNKLTLILVLHSLKTLFPLDSFIWVVWNAKNVYVNGGKLSHIKKP